MAYRLSIDDDLNANIRRIAGDQIDRALKELSGKNATPATVHEARKCLKRIRALLRLVRPGLSAKLFTQENHRFRQIAQMLSQARDMDCLDEAALKLAANAPTASLDALSNLRQAIDTQRKSDEEVNVGSLRNARDSLKDAANAYRRISLEAPHHEVLKDGLAACYRKARRAQHAAYESGEDETFHEWRKPVQQHWRHMALFMAAWPDFFRARVEVARSLSQFLGDDHDLSLLIGFIEKSANRGELKKEAARNLQDIARARQNALRIVASPLGQMLFHESSRAHAKHIFGIWCVSKKVTLTAADNHAKHDKHRLEISSPRQPF